MRFEDVVEGFVLLLHLLVVAAALIGGPGPDVVAHAPENLIGAPEFVPEEMPFMHRQEGVVHLLFTDVPVAYIFAAHLALSLAPLFSLLFFCPQLLLGRQTAPGFAAAPDGFFIEGLGVLVVRAG